MTRKTTLLLLLAALLAQPTLATVPSESSYITATGNGVTTVFTFTFAVTTSSSDVKVFLNGVQQSSGYTVALNANQTSSPGGTVTFTAAPANGIAVKIQRTVAVTQPTTFSAYGPYRAKDVEKALDRLAYQAQQIHRYTTVDQDARDDAQDLALAQGAVGGNDTFITATGTSTPRKLKDRFADFINPTDTGAGAKCDGATDDAAALAAAQTAAGATKGIVITCKIRIASAAGTISAPLRFEGLGSLDLQAGGSVTLSGPLTALVSQIFYSNGGTLTFSAQALRVVPQWWGAKPDGGITDNRDAIEAAAAALAGRPGVLHFPAAANYYGTSPVCIVGDQFSGLTIEGDGSASRIKLTSEPTMRFVSGIACAAPLTVSAATAGSLSGLTIRNMRFSAFSTTSVSGYKVLNLTWANNVVVENCELDTGGSEGLYSAANPVSEGLIVRNNHFHDIGKQTGLAAIDPGGRNIRIEGNRVEDVGQFVEANVDHLIIAGNRFRNSVNNSGTLQPGITARTWYVTGTDPQKVDIHDNLLELSSAAIVVTANGNGGTPSSSAVAQIVVANNRVYNATNGIHVVPDAYTLQVNIRDNQLRDATASGSGTGIQLDGVGLIEGNLMEIQTYQWSQFVRTDLATAENTAIRNNTFKGNPTSDTIYSNRWRPELSGNVILGNPTNKSYFWGGVQIRPLAGAAIETPETILSTVRRSYIVATAASLPSNGSYKAGDRIDYGTATAGGLTGQVCTVAGTIGTLTGITGSITTGTNTLAVSSISTIGIGAALSIAGVTGTKYVTAIAGTTVTLDTNADATVSGAAVQYVAPTFRPVGTKEATVSADRGDTSQTLTVGTDVQVQRWATTLTANRTVTCSTTGAANGDAFRVVRTGLGAFTLDVCGLKTIPSATAAFVDVSYNGSAWVLTAYGGL